jgi:hypothetical protein
MGIAAEVKKLGLPKNSYIVVGSGIMSALNIRDSNDIDLTVTHDVFVMLQKQGWEKGESDFTNVLQKYPFDVGEEWAGKTSEELLSTATVIDGVPFLSLGDLRDWKQKHARPKDLQDICLIDNYLALRHR